MCLSDERSSVWKAVNVRRVQFLSPTNPLRSWARRVSRSVRDRPDVRIKHLERRISILERSTQLPEGAEARIKQAVDLLTPRVFEGLTLQRVGSEYDGGYVLPVNLMSECRGVVSIGVGSNNDCDIALARMGQQIHAWDHTVDGLPNRHNAITFHKVGLGSGTDLRDLKHICEASFGKSATGLALMLDAEGAEWEAINLQPGALSGFDIMAIEFHDLGDLLLQPDPILPALQTISRDFVPVAVHVNNHGGLWEVGPFPWPDALEVTYVRKSHLETPSHRGNCDPQLFRPCCVDLADPQISWLTQG